MIVGAVMEASLLTDPAGPEVVMPHERSARLCIEAWNTGITVFESSPVSGIDYRMFEQHHVRAAHNSFAECLTELGSEGARRGPFYLKPWGLAAALFVICLAGVFATIYSWKRLG